MLAISSDFPSRQLPSLSNLEVVTVSVYQLLPAAWYMYPQMPQLNTTLNLLITWPPLSLYLTQS